MDCNFQNFERII